MFSGWTTWIFRQEQQGVQQPQGHPQQQQPRSQRKSSATIAYENLKKRNIETYGSNNTNTNTIRKTSTQEGGSRKNSGQQQGGRKVGAKNSTRDHSKNNEYDDGLFAGAYYNSSGSTTSSSIGVSNSSGDGDQEFSNVDPNSGLNVEDWVWICSERETEPNADAVSYDYAWYPFVDDDPQRSGQTRSFSSANPNPVGAANQQQHSNPNTVSIYNEWQVTPPSCFTRQDVPEIERQMYKPAHYDYNSSEYRRFPPKPASTEISVIENLLIEHPSMSIFDKFPERFADIRSETLMHYKNNRAKQNSIRNNDSLPSNQNLPHHPDIFKCTENTKLHQNYHRHHHKPSNNSSPPNYSDVFSTPSATTVSSRDENKKIIPPNTTSSSLLLAPPYYDDLSEYNLASAIISQRSSLKNGANSKNVNAANNNGGSIDFSTGGSKKKNYHHASNNYSNHRANNLSSSNSENYCNSNNNSNRSGLKNTYKKLV